MRGYVSVRLTNMRRILSTSILSYISLLERNLPSRASLTLGQQSVFAQRFCRKVTTDSSSMDLSDMRKKYKGDEEVSSLCHKVGNTEILLKSSDLSV